MIKCSIRDCENDCEENETLCAECKEVDDKLKKVWKEKTEELYLEDLKEENLISADSLNG